MNIPSSLTAIEQFQQCFRRGEAFEDPQSGLRVHTEPGSFPVGVVRRPVEDARMRRVRQSLLRLPFSRKCNDLYDFLQSPDLANREALSRILGGTQ